MVQLSVRRLVVAAVLCGLAVTTTASNKLGRHKQKDKQPPTKQQVHNHQQHSTDHSHDPYPQQGFTLVIPTYKHLHVLEKLINHLTHPKPPPSLSQIVIVWLNVGVPLPAFLEPDALAHLRRDTGVPVTVRLSQRNSRNEHLRPFRGWGERILTRAVMLLEDDVVLRKETIEWGWHEFVRANPPHVRRTPRTGKLVGFQGKDWIHHPHRKHDGEEWEFASHSHDRAGLMLTSAAWVKTEWLEHYWDEGKEMSGLRSFVDKTRDCEDLLLNFVASNLSHTAPLLLQPAHALRTAAPGDLSPGSQHFDHVSHQVERDATRSHCLAHFFAHFATHAPKTDGTRPAHYPLRRAHSSVSQDLADHSRVMWDDEEWEEEEELEPVSIVGGGVARIRGADGVAGLAAGEHKEKKEEEEDDDDEEEDEEEDDDDDEDVAGTYFNQWEALLADMTDEEVAELMEELAIHHETHPTDEGAHGGDEGGEDDGEDEHHRDEL